MNTQFFVALAQNAGLLLATLVVFDLLTARGKSLAGGRSQIVAGVAVGAIGMLMIAAAVPLGGGFIFDTRSVLIAISGLFFGFIPTVIAVAIISAFRLVVGGPAALIGVSVIVASGATGVAWNHLRRHRALESISWRELYGFGLVVHVVMLALLYFLPSNMGDAVVRAVAVPLMVVHPLATLVVGLLFVQRLRFHRTTADLAVSENRFRLLAENAMDVIFRYDFLPEPRFTYVSPSSVAITGYTPEEYYADPELGRKLVHPHDRPLLEASRRGEVPSDQPLVLRWIRKDGEIRWTEQRNSYVRDGDGQIIAAEGIVRDITLTTQADLMLRMALKATSQGITDYNIETGHVRVSEEYARILGYDPGDFSETFEQWRARLHPDDVESVTGALRAYLEGESPDYRAEMRLRTRDGRYIWLLSLASIVARDSAGKPLRLIGTHTDITPLKSAQERAREAESELRRLTEILEASQATAHVGSCELDVESGSIFWSNETYRIFDTTPDTYTPTLDSLKAFFTPASRATFEQILRDAQERGTPHTVELELIGASGRSKWVQFSSSATPVDMERQRVTCAIQDITERKAEEQERLELMAQLHQAQKLDSLGSLAGGVAHDLNNVLAAILSSAEAHRRRLPDADPVARALDTIATACIRGRSVVRSLLYFARTGIETRGPVGLNVVARDIVDLLDKTTLKRVRFVLDLDEGLPDIDGDEAALNHALMNVCINAVDAMPHGGDLTIRTRLREDGNIELSVHDTGVGMDADVSARAAEPFFTTKPAGKGTGLGLAMVYGAVKAHDGALEIRSAPGEGTEVTLVFPPMARDHQHAMPRVAATSPESAARRILLIDDDELIRAGVGALLELNGHEVHLAESGTEGLRLLESGLEPDVVVLDVNMPGMTGPQTLERILAMRPWQRVLMASGYGDDAMLRAMRDRPNVLAIQKPFTIDDLEAKLDALRS